MSDISRPTENRALRNLTEQDRLRARINSQPPLQDYDATLWAIDRRDPVNGAINAAARRCIPLKYIQRRLKLISDTLLLEDMQYGG